MKSYELKAFGLENLEQVQRPQPVAGAGEVLVRLRAASLNRRDLLFVQGTYNPRASLPAVPLSDGAGEVVEVGAGVTQFTVGQRVCPIFNQAWLQGPPRGEDSRRTLGAGDLPGVLREFAAFPANALVEIPPSLSYEEAATLPCAGVTAWHALVVAGKVRAGQTVLLLGTGGVSLFALQIARMHGARVMLVSSNDDKLERAGAMGVEETLNYTREPRWDKAALEWTGGAGVDHVVEVGGAGTLLRSLGASCVGGHIAVIGVLSEGEGQGVDVRRVLMKSLRLTGIFVGSRAMLAELCAALQACEARPAIDRVFGFDEVPAALRYMQSNAHFGKIVVRY